MSEGVQSREGRARAKAGPQSQSKLHSSNWHVPPDDPEPDRPTVLGSLPPLPIADVHRVGLGNDPDVDLEGLFLPEGQSPSCAELAAGWVSWLPEMALGQAGLSGQDYISSVPYFRPRLWLPASQRPQPLLNPRCI